MSEKRNHVWVIEARCKKGNRRWYATSFVRFDGFEAQSEVVHWNLNPSNASEYRARKYVAEESTKRKK